MMAKPFELNHMLLTDHDLVPFLTADKSYRQIPLDAPTLALIHMGV
jgi:hypothetical protein